MASGYSIGDFSIGSLSIGGDELTAPPPFDPSGQKCGGGIQPAPCCCCREYLDDFDGAELSEDWTVYSGEWHLASGLLVETEDDALMGIKPFGSDVDCAYWRVEVDVFPFSGVSESTWSVWIGSQADRLVAELELRIAVSEGDPLAQWYTRIIRETTGGREVLAQQLVYGVDPPETIYLCVVPFDDGYVARARGLEVEVEPIRTAEVGLGVRNISGIISSFFDNFRAHTKAADGVATACDCPATTYESRCGSCDEPNPEQYQITLAGFTGDFAFLNASWILNQCTTVSCAPEVGVPSQYPCSYWYPIDQPATCGSFNGTIVGLALKIRSSGVDFWVETRTAGGSRSPQVWLAATANFDCAEGGDDWTRTVETITCTAGAEVEVSVP